MDLPVILLLFTFLRCSTGFHLPPNINTCRRSDPNIDECLRSSVEGALIALADGDKHLGIVPLEPLRLEMISVGQTPESTVRVSQKFLNVSIHGLSSTKVRKFVFDFDKCHVDAETLSPLIRSRANYELDGQLLLFPIHAKGDSNVTSTNLSIKHSVTCEKYAKKGKEYIRMTDYRVTMTPKGMHYSFANLFPGNEELSGRVMQTVNEHALEIFEEVRKAMEESHGIIFKEITNQLFTKVPFKEIFRD